MKERFKRKKITPLLGVIAILCLLIGVVLLAAIIYVATDAMTTMSWNPWFMQYVEYIILIIAGVLFVRHWMTEYEYDVIDNDFIIDRYIGRRPRNLVHIKLSSIVSIGKDKPDIKKMDRLTFKSKRSGVTYIVYKQNGQQKCLYFSPSDKLVCLINERRTHAHS